MRRYDEAHEAVDQLLQVLPESAPLWHLKAKLLTWQDKWADADHALDEALHRAPDLCGAWIDNGEVLLQLGSPADALSAFDRALALQPDNAEARNGRKRAQTGWHARYVTRLLPDVLEALIVLAFRH